MVTYEKDNNRLQGFSVYLQEQIYGISGEKEKKNQLALHQLEISGNWYIYICKALLLETFFLERSTKEGLFLMAKGLKWPDACYLPLSLGFEKKAVNLSPFKRY